MYAIYSFQACRACTFDRPGLATIGAYPGCICMAETYAIGIVLFLNSFVQQEYHSRINPFIAGKWVRCRKRKYNPQGGSIFVCIITQGSLLSSATPGYRKYNRDAVVFPPLPAHRNGWDVWAEGLPAFPIGWNSLLDSLPIYSDGRKSRTEGLPAYSNRWDVLARRLPVYPIGWDI